MHAGSDRPRRRTVLCTVRVHGRKCGFWERFFSCRFVAATAVVLQENACHSPIIFHLPPFGLDKNPGQFPLAVT